MSAEQSTATSTHDEIKSLDRFPGYGVSKPGGVFTRKGVGCKPVMTEEWRPKAARVNTHGYLAVDLWVSGNPVTIAVHILVLEAFKGPCPPGLECCHEDGNRLNCHIDNLRWDTHQSNLADCKRHGTSLLGVKNPRSKLTDTNVSLARERHQNGETVAALARCFCVSPSVMHKAVNRETWKHVI